MDDTVIAIHALVVGRGNLIKNTHHSRNLENAITPYIEFTIKALGSSEKARQFVEYIKKIKPRYTRDQLQIINCSIQDVDMDVVNNAVLTCVAGKMYSAADFKCVVEHLNEIKISKQKESLIENNIIYETNEKASPNSIDNLRLLNIKPQTRSLDVYGNIAKRRN